MCWICGARVTMSDYDDYMADVEQALRGVYSGAEGVLRAVG
jgi:hypothetical protein